MRTRPRSPESGGTFCIRAVTASLLRRECGIVANCEDDLWDDAAIHLRSLLAVAPQQVYDEAVAALTLLRGGSPPQRIAASYSCPTG